MIDKHPIRRERLRQVPSGFSWVDHRLIRHRRLENCSHQAWALYLFLVTVGDAQGLSYYSDAALCRHLKMEPLQLTAARGELQKADLVAYQRPLYQVLSLEDPVGRPGTPEAPRSGQLQSVGEILRRALSGGAA